MLQYLSWSLALIELLSPHRLMSHWISSSGQGLCILVLLPAPWCYSSAPPMPISVLALGLPLRCVDWCHRQSKLVTVFGAAIYTEAHQSRCAGFSVNRLEMIQFYVVCDRSGYKRAIWFWSRLAKSQTVAGKRNNVFLKIGKRTEKKHCNSAYLLPLLLVFNSMGFHVFPQGTGIGVTLCTARHLARVRLLSKHKHTHTQTHTHKVIWANRVKRRQACERL